MKLLLVEDNDVDVLMVQRLMRRLSLDYPIIRARNGEEALAILRPANASCALTPPFIILLDINMPRMDGFEFLDELSDDVELNRIPIYIVSTSTRSKDQERAKNYPVRGYVIKPVTQASLLEMLAPPDRLDESIA